MEYILIVLLCFFILCYIAYNIHKDKERKQKQKAEAEKKYQEQQKRLKELNKKDEEKYNYINKKIEESLNVLKNKYRQLAYKDDYGLIKTDKFEREVDYFLEKIVNKYNILSPQNKKDIKDTLVNYMLRNIDLDDIDINTTNPYTFEKQCAITLNNHGWNANTTPKSSDQGVDVIAEKNGKSIAIQCKLYSKPVGNKAVQEVNTGKSYYKTDYAAVVTNNTYTTAARRLAQNCGVLLLFYDDLENLDSILNI